MSRASDRLSNNAGLSPGTNRRTLVAAIGGLGLMLPGLQAADARKRNRRKKRDKRRKKQPVAPPGIPPAAIQVAASCSGTSNNSAGVVPPQRVAQTFTAAASGSLIRAEVTIAKVADSVGDFLLQVGRVDNFGVPTNDVLAVAFVANPDVPKGTSTVTFTFPNPAPVTAGVRFALVLSRTGNDEVFWPVIEGDQCGGGAFRSADQTAPFSRFIENADFIYTAFVQ